MMMIMMMMKNIVQIYDELRSIQRTISHRDTHKNTAQTSTVIINNGNKNISASLNQTHSK